MIATTVFEYFPSYPDPLRDPRARTHPFWVSSDEWIMLGINGDGAKAEALAANRAEAIPRDWFVNWLWGDLQAEFGFHPPG